MFVPSHFYEQFTYLAGALAILRIAKKKGFDLVCAEFWMDDSIDPYNYEKFTSILLTSNTKVLALSTSSSS